MLNFLPRLVIACLLSLQALIAFADTGNEAARRADGIYQMTGFARSMENGAPIYRELHRIEVADGLIRRHTVDYVSPDGKPVSDKSISYRKSPYLPEFELEDARDAYREGASFSAAGYRVFRQTSDDESRSKTFKTGPDHVADAGFDNFVRANLNRLIAGERIGFKFIVAGFLDELSFRARRIDTEAGSESSATFQVEPDSLLRIFVDPIRVTYDIRSGDLLRYEGVTNIRDGDGKRFRAIIDYPPEQRSFEPLSS